MMDCFVAWTYKILAFKTQLEGIELMNTLGNCAKIYKTQYQWGALGRHGFKERSAGSAALEEGSMTSPSRYAPSCGLKLSLSHPAYRHAIARRGMNLQALTARSPRLMSP